jgi:uncharacterized protein involved in outer membrane biogenesis
MDFLASPFGVVLILAIVAIAAFTFQPTKYVGIWQKVAECYETEIRFRADKGSKHNFQVRLKKPVDFFVSPELGGAMQRRSLQMPPGVK